jgi:hypothetical protein
VSINRIGIFVFFFQIISLNVLQRSSKNSKEKLTNKNDSGFDFSFGKCFAHAKNKRPSGTTSYIQNATDVVSAVTPISASIAFNNYACMYMCTVNSNCALAVFKSTSSNCSLYDSSAQARIICAADSVSYQKQINGSV